MLVHKIVQTSQVMPDSRQFFFLGCVCGRVELGYEWDE